MGITVNADDYGKSNEINRAICEAFKNGYIDTTTLMANMPGVETAYDIAKENGFVDKVGVHLNITEGMPLTESIRRNPLICADDGSFNAAFYHNTKYRLYMDQLTIKQIEEEFDAQIQLFLSLGFSELHIDSHHHVHTNYPVYKALKRLGKKYDFKYIRLSRNLYKGGSLPNKIYKSIYNGQIKSLAESASQIFGSYKDYMEYFELNPMRVADRSKDMTPEMKNLISGREIEIMVHPMYDEDGRLVDTDIPMNEEGYALGR